MRLRIDLDGRKRNVSLRRQSTVSDLLKKLGTRKETVLVKVNGRFRPDDFVIEEGATVEIMTVVFGG